MTRPTDRGVSTTLGYVLTLSITVVLVAGLMVASGSFVAGERERVTQTELEVVGHRLAATLESADRLASAPGATTLETTTTLPNRVAGTTYTIRVDPGTPAELVLTSTDPRVTVRVTVETTVPVANSSVGGGEVTVTFDEASGELEVSG